MSIPIQVIPYNRLNNQNSRFDEKIAQIVGEYYTDTIQKEKFSGTLSKFQVPRYKIRILSIHNDNTPPTDLPWAYPQVQTSGLGGQSSGAPIYSPNSFVDVRENNNGEYIIIRVHVNTIRDLPKFQQLNKSYVASGFIPGSEEYLIPQTHFDASGIVNGSELFNTPVPSEEDKKQNNLNEASTLPSKCRKVDTDAVNQELTKLIKDIQDLKIGLVGKDSFLQTSQNFLNDVQTKISNASAKIAGFISWLVQEVRRFVMRKINATVRNLIGNAPLSTRYLANEVTGKTLSTISCLFVRLLENLENLIANALRGLLDKIINTASCLIEGFLSNFIGQIVSQLTAVINGILGPLSSLLGSVISFTSEILDFAISIIDFLTCKVKNVCPTTESWNPLEGGQTQKFNLDFNRIFNSAKGVVSSFNNVINIPENIDNFNFNLKTPEEILNGCNTGAIFCGPPNVIFGGGSGSGATGNAVINALGELIGVNITTPGNYTQAPFINFEDPCGNGVGAYGIPIIGPIDTIGIGGIDGIGIGTGGIGGTGIGTGGIGGTGIGTGGIGGTGIGTGGIGGTGIGTGGIGGTGIGTGGTGTGGTGIGTGGIGGTGIGTGGIGTGVIGVAIIKDGYGYLPKPDGSKGGMNRVWADRCQTIVKRANGNWDPPYSLEQPIKLFFGDMIQLPGKGEVNIDCDFTVNKLPGCIVTGKLTCFKSMIGFDDGKGGTQFGLPNIKSMVGFDDIRGSTLENTPPIPPEHRKRVVELLKTTESENAFKRDKELIERGIISGAFRPDQFGFENDYPFAKELGFTDQDIRFYIEGFYSKLLGKRIGPLMQVVLADPNFGPLPKYIKSRGRAGEFDCENDYPYAISLGFSDQDIRYYLQNIYTGDIDDCMRKKLNDPKWGRIPEFYVTITAPGCPPKDPDKDNIDAEIDDVYIEDPGFGFDPKDTATVLDCVGNPDASSEVQLKIENGKIVNVRVIKSGKNFTCIPKIRLNTQTGYNARLKPILKFGKSTGVSPVPEGTSVISVIDCVGKV